MEQTGVIDDDQRLVCLHDLASHLECAAHGSRTRFGAQPFDERPTSKAAHGQQGIQLSHTARNDAPGWPLIAGNLPKLFAKFEDN